MNFLRNLLSPKPTPVPLPAARGGERFRKGKLPPNFEKNLRDNWLIITGAPVKEIVVAEFRDCPNLMPKTFAAALLIPLGEKSETVRVGGTVLCYACQHAFEFEFILGGDASKCRDVECPACHAVVELEHRALAQFPGELDEFEGREGQLLTVRPGVENKKLSVALPIALTVDRCRLVGAFPKDILGGGRT